jgi:hypothetical protein
MIRLEQQRLFLGANPQDNSTDELKLQINDAGVSEQPTTLASTLYRKHTMLKLLRSAIE